RLSTQCCRNGLAAPDAPAEGHSRAARRAQRSVQLGDRHIDGGISWDWLLRLGVGLVAAYVVFQIVFGQRADFVLRLRKGSVQYEGQFPLAQQRTLSQLLLQDMALKESIQIQGTWSGGRVRLWFRGKLSAAEKQRIRNFLTNRL